MRKLIDGLIDCDLNMLKNRTQLSNLIQVFQTDPLPQVYKIKHPAMQSALTISAYKTAKKTPLSLLKHIKAV